MQTRLKIFFYGLAVLGLFSCGHGDTEGFRISGVVKNADKLAQQVPGGIADQGSGRNAVKVYLEKISFGKEAAPVLLDSAKISGSTGTFSLSGKGRQGDLLELVFGENLVQVPLICDGHEISLEIDLGTREDFYTVKGSEGSNQLRELISNFARKSEKADKNYLILDSLRKHGSPDSLINLASQEETLAINDLNTYLRDFMFTANNPTLAVICLGWASQSFPPRRFDSVLVALNKKFPDNIVLRNMKKSYDTQVARQAEKVKSDAANSWIGKQAPDFSMPDPNGKSISLSSFKGKYVLVDFWASWCAPCRSENPNVVSAYRKFKNRNFTILGVSLDKEKDSWLEAIRQDQLSWTQISDLQYWNSKAVDIFKFEGIPFNILVDPQGKIVAQELRGDQLDSKLSELLH